MSLWPIGRLLDSLDTGGVIAIDAIDNYEMHSGTTELTDFMKIVCSSVPSSVSFVI